MNRENILNSFTILDLSSRLPGPLSCKSLWDLGAEVIKIENLDHEDSFKSITDQIQRNLFNDWYQNINQDKDFIKFSYSEKNSHEKLKKYLNKCSGAIISLPSKIKNNLKLDNQTLKNLNGPKVFLNLYATKDKRTPLHDLGALARSGALNFHTHSKQFLNADILPPPFLPIAGIQFSNAIVSKFLALSIKASLENKVIVSEIFLDDIINSSFKNFLPIKAFKQGGDEENIQWNYSHNGAYPCYCIYRLKDNHFAVVSMLENSYWKNFIKSCSLDSKVTQYDQYYNKDERVFNLLSDFFKKSDKKSLLDLIATHSLHCLDIT